MSFYSTLRQEAAYGVVAVQFLTRLPVPVLRSFRASWLDGSSAYFPLVGLLVGGIGAAILVVANLVWPWPIPAILAVASAIAATGAFHEDGLADTADGLGGGQSPAQRLEIMKDSRLGTYGALALLVMLGLKVASLSMFSPLDGALALVAAHMGARAVPVVASRWMAYVGDVTSGKVAPVKPSQNRMLFALACGLAPFLLIPWVPAAIALVAASLAAAGLLGKAKHLIGGQTGDVLGAAEQTFETVVLLALAGFA